MEEKSPKAKWQGKVSSTLTKANANQIWPLFLDFFNLHKWFRNLSTCHGVHGTNGEVGGTRYCAGTSLPNEDGVDQVCWSMERLVAVDPEKMSMSYEMVDCNIIGYKSYFSTIKVVSNNGHDGCMVEWSFVVNPIDWSTYEGLVEKYQTGLDQATKKMEDALVQSNV